MPTFNNEPLHELQQRQGEPAKDRDRRAAVILFRDALSMYSHSVVSESTYINYGHSTVLTWVCQPKVASSMETLGRHRNERGTLYH